MRKLLVAIFSSLALFSANVHAAPASPESVEKLLVAMKSEAHFNLMFGYVEGMGRQMVEQAKKEKEMSAEQQRALEAFPAKLVALMREDFSWSKMQPMMVQMYVEMFDQKEVDDLTAFYDTPTGQAFIKKMPLVMQKSMAMTQSMMQSLMPKMKKAMDEAAAETKVTK